MKPAAVQTAVPGHDGNPPEFRPARDLEGRGKRSAAGLQNINTDRLEWLLTHRHIDVAQHGAGRRLQGDREMAVIGGYAMSPAFGAGSAAGGLARRPSAPADIKCDAIRRMNAARAHVGRTGFRILELIVLENVAVAEAARRLAEPPAKLPMALKVALDSLASFYRLA